MCAATIDRLHVNVQVASSASIINSEISTITKNKLHYSVTYISLGSIPWTTAWQAIVDSLLLSIADSLMTLKDQGTLQIRKHPIWWNEKIYQQFHQFLELINRKWSFRCARWSTPVIPKININTPYQKKLHAQRTKKFTFSKSSTAPLASSLAWDSIRRQRCSSRYHCQVHVSSKCFLAT